MVERTSHVIRNELFRLPSQFKYLQWHFSVQQSTNLKLNKPPKPKPKRKPEENLYHIKLCSKAVELTNLPAIFNNANVKSSLNKSIDFAVPTVIYGQATAIVSIFLISINLF